LEDVFAAPLDGWEAGPGGWKEAKRGLPMLGGAASPTPVKELVPAEPTHQ